MDKIITVSELTKVFRLHKHYRGFGGSLRNLISRQSTEIRAVDGVTFAIEKGECVGYIGPNGAGKSTTIKMLTGLLVPSGGMVNVEWFCALARANQICGKDWGCIWAKNNPMVGSTRD